MTSTTNLPPLKDAPLQCYGCLLLGDYDTFTIKRVCPNCGSLSVHSPEAQNNWSKPHEKSRLTDNDLVMMHEAMKMAVTDLDTWRNDPMGRTTLERICMHAIGCTESSLRDTELGEIRTLVQAMLQPKVSSC